MSDLVNACPECDTLDIARRVYLDGYRCKQCTARFDTPAKRPRAETASTVGGLSPIGKRLLAMDPDEVPP